MRSQRFQLVHYGEDAAEHWPGEKLYPTGSESAIKAKAGRLSKRIRGPVDIAHYGNEPWNERYITTASPSEHHATGYRFERLDS
jgi:hypothetical protein